MDPHSQSRLQEVHPILAQKIQQLGQMLMDEKITLIVTQGLRSWAQQEALYEKGRTKQPDGTWHVTGPIVTNAPPGYSWHQFGLAVDVAPINPDGSIDWNAKHPQWTRIEEVGVSLGMVSGANWVRMVDCPHLQLTGRFPVTPTDEARQILLNEGIKALWDESGIT